MLDTRTLPCPDSRTLEPTDESNTQSKHTPAEVQSLYNYPDSSDHDVVEDTGSIEKLNVGNAKSDKTAKGYDKSALLAEQTACRERLQLIKDKTYLVRDTAVLGRVREHLDDIISELRGAVVTEKGIPLEQPTKVDKNGWKKAQYLPLKKRKGKKKFSGRSGLKASIMRKTFMVDVPITSSQPSDNSQTARKRKLAKNSCSYGCGNHSIPVQEKESPAKNDDVSKVPLVNQFKAKENVRTNGIVGRVSDIADDPGHPLPNQSMALKNPGLHERASSGPCIVPRSPDRRRPSDKENIDPCPTNETSELNPTTEPPSKRRRPDPCMDTSTLTSQEAVLTSLPFKPERPVQPGQHFLPIKVVQGSTSQQCEDRQFCESNRGKQCTSNRFTFLLHHAKFPERKVSKNLIDAVLKVGDRVHTVLARAIGNPGDKLSLEELQAALKITGECGSLTFPQGILTGDIFSKASNSAFVTLEKALYNALQANTGSLLRFLDYTVGIKKLPDGCLVLFDPHARNSTGFVDGNGSAITMVFSTLEAVADHIRRFVTQKGYEERAPVLGDDMLMVERCFEVLPICSGEVDSILSRLLKRTNKQRKITR